MLHVFLSIEPLKRLAEIGRASKRGVSKAKNMEHILDRKADFEAFKNEAQLIEKTCNPIQSSILLWKEYLENMIENNQWLCEISYY